MKPKSPIRPALAAFAATAGLAIGSAAWAAPLPPIQTQGGVTFTSGGIGRGEATAMQAQASRWPLTLEFAVRQRKGSDDAFVADVKVQVLDGQQRRVLDSVSKGPFLLARLDPGRYEIKATFGGETLTREIHLTAGHPLREVFVWPHGLEKTAS